MRIGILSRKGTLYSTRRLREAAEERGHDVRVVDPLRCYMDITAKSPRVVLGGERLQIRVDVAKNPYPHVGTGPGTAKSLHENEACALLSLPLFSENEIVPLSKCS